MESYYAAPRGGVEVGGVFFGVTAGESLHILAYRPVSCQYLMGPSFKLSVDDKAGLSNVLALPDSDPKLAKLSALGWYHSHHRSEIFLSQEDLALYNEFFPGRQQVALVLRPAHMKATRAGFFFRDAEGLLQAHAPLQEFIVDPPGKELMLLEEEAQSALEQLLDAHCVRPHGGDRDVLLAAAKLEAPACEPKPAPQALVVPLAQVVSGTVDTEGLAARSERAIPAERDIRFDPPPWTTVAARGFQRGVPPKEIAEAVEAQAPTAPAVPVKEEAAEKTSRGGWWLCALRKLVLGSERRSANRTAGTGLAAFFWDGDRPKAHAVRDISRRGVFVESEFLWAQGTMIVLTLQIGGKSPAGKGPMDAITIPAKVVRSAPGGMGLRFLFPRVEDMRAFLQFLLRWKPDLKL